MSSIFKFFSHTGAWIMSALFFFQSLCFQCFAGDDVMKIWFDEPSDTEILNMSEKDCWESRSLPLGNGYMGLCVFGRTDTERVQITENTLSNPAGLGGLNNFSETYIDFGHKNVTEYYRDLCLETATANVSYRFKGVKYTREYFTDYPDNVAVIHLTASKGGRVSFTLRPTVPYVKDYGLTPGDGGGKSGTVTADGSTLILSGRMNYYGIDFEGQYRVLHDGGTLTVCHDEDGGNARLVLDGADSATVLITVGTNYVCESRVFTEPDPKKKLEPYPHPHEKVTALMNNAASLGYERLRENHLADYKSLFGRVSLDLGGRAPVLTTDKLLRMYRNVRRGSAARYLEELYFQFGRYLLISSSREGTPPANLQGVWNMYDDAPWTAGYWHNINVQMNYWPAFTTNLAETFTAYADYNAAYMELAQMNADSFILENFPNSYDGEGNNGWTIGTAAWLYTIGGISSAPSCAAAGAGAFTSMLFWDWYDFSSDERLLRERIYPLLRSMSVFLSKNLVQDENGYWLCKYSVSPEQEHDGTYYMAPGCAFDQQMIWQSFYQTVTAARILGEQDDPFIVKITEQMTRLDPVQIGGSGQVKEFRAENLYGEIGEYHHRHISQLVALYPGTLITRDTTEWLDAAKVTLNERGDESTGWAMAHRLCLWARTGDGERAHKLYSTLLSEGTLDNLWDTHPPFQIDGNFGGTSGVAEMLMQSQAGYVELLPALPDEWSNGSFTGLVARGNFEISLGWSGKHTESATVLSRSGGEFALLASDGVAVTDSAGNPIDYTASDGIIRFDTVKGGSYAISFN